MSFLQKINPYITTPHLIIPSNRPRNTFWPSEVSYKTKDGKVLGKCHRQAWYDYHNFQPTNPIDAKGITTIDMGKMAEGWYIEKAKQIGVWAANSVKYFDHDHNISAEIDLIIFEQNLFVGVECKSYYGHYAEKEVQGFPKIQHLMQTMLYLDFMNRVIDERWSKKFYIEYYGRDTCNKYEHTVTLEQRGDTLVPLINGIAHDLVETKGIYDRYDELAVLVNLDTPPTREFIYEYSDEQVEEKNKRGEISKTKYNAWKKNQKTISDWQCLYCAHLDRCWPSKRRGNGKERQDGQRKEVKKIGTQQEDKQVRTSENENRSQ